MPGDGRCAAVATETATQAVGAPQPQPSKTEKTIDSLTRLLNATPAAEELESSWRVTSICDPRPSNGEPRLADLYRALDAGRTIAWTDGQGSRRGVPMWIVVRTCKAKWHQDGTWPLLGKDEKVQSGGEPVPPPPPRRSIHPSDLLLRPINVDSFLLPADAALTTRSKPEPSAEEIAQAYRRRGIAVDEALEEETSDW